MVTVQNNRSKKPSGGRFKQVVSKTLNQMHRSATLTKIGDKKTKLQRVLGGDVKVRLRQANVANVYDPKTKKYIKAKITKLVENSANRNFVRQNIITKGAVIETDKGKAKVTSRPGQDGIVNAILV